MMKAIHDGGRAGYPGWPTPRLALGLSRRTDGLIEEVDASEGGLPSHTSIYGYDRSHRLSTSERTAGGLTVSSHVYDHDPNGNIISLVGNVRIVHPVTGRLKWNSGDGCTYDANGALVECSSDTRTLALEWDACGGRLERVLVDRVAGDDKVAEYSYDYANRRIGKRVCAGEGIAACPEGTGTETKYVWSGDRLIAEMDGAGDIKRVYTWLGVVPVMVTDYLTSIEGQPFERSWAVASDWRGAAVRAYDLYDGAVAWSAEYDDLGTATVAAGNTVSLNWRFAGQYYDAETGYHYNNQRYYEPATGRYLSMDPIGYNGGSLNLYGYASGDPVNGMDPTGEFLPVILVGAGAYLFASGLGLLLDSERPDTSPVSPSTNSFENMQGWELMPFYLSTTHMIGDPTQLFNSKYVNGNWEAVYDISGDLISSGSNVGTYNFGENPLTHWLFDIQPWLINGTGKCDPSTPWQRMGAFLHGAAIIGIDRQ